MATTTFNGSFTPAVIPDRGKRRMDADHQYAKQDFLKGSGPIVNHPIGETSLRASRFKVGFYRKPHAAIIPEADRMAFEAKKAERAAVVAEGRVSILTDQSSRHGNIINGELKSNEDLAPQRALRRGGYASQASEMSVDHKIRQRVGAGRFHRAEDDNEKRSRLNRQQASLLRQQQTSSVIGYGRNDIPSEGVLDAFSGHGYANIKQPPLPNDVSQQAAGSARRATDSAAVTTAAASGRLRSHQSAPSSTDDSSSSARSVATTAAAGGGSLPEAARVRARGRGGRGQHTYASNGVADAFRPSSLSNTGAAIVASSSSNNAATSVKPVAAAATVVAAGRSTANTNSNGGTGIGISRQTSAARRPPTNNIITHVPIVTPSSAAPAAAAPAAAVTSVGVSVAA